MRRLRRFLHRASSERRLLIAALFWVMGARLVVSLFSFPALARFLSRPRAQKGPKYAPERIAWAVAAAARFVPGAACLTQAVAAHLLLRRAGHHAVICLGVLNNAGEGFCAHAWVESEGRVLVGAGRRQAFTPLVQIG